MSKCKDRFEGRVVPGFNNIFGIFDTKENRFRSRDEAGKDSHRFMNENILAATVERLNKQAVAAQKALHDEEFDNTKAPTKRRGKTAANTNDAIPAPEPSHKRRRSTPKVEVPTTAPEVQHQKGRRKKAA